jgi:hypothetical protein
MVEDNQRVTDKHLISAIDQAFPQPMENETLEWLGQIMRPFFVSVMSDPEHLVFSKMLPNPIKMANQSSLASSNAHTQMLLSSNFNNYFSKDELAQVQAKFLYKLKEFTDVLSSNMDLHRPPLSLVEYLSKGLLYQPEVKQLWTFELNRIAFERSAPTFLDRELIQDEEYTMLVGFFIVAKMLIIKVFMNSHRYS